MTSSSLKLGKQRKPLTESPEQRERRLRAWNHTRLMGNTKMIQKQAETIAAADTVNYAAKALAMKMAGLAKELEEQLRFRVDHPLPAS